MAPLNKPLFVIYLEFVKEVLSFLCSSENNFSDFYLHVVIIPKIFEGMLKSRTLAQITIEVLKE